MNILRSVIGIALAVGLVLGLAGCATSPGQGAYSPTSSETKYWKEKYEAERSKNQTDDFVEAMEAFSEGMDSISESLDEFMEGMFK